MSSEFEFAGLTVSALLITSGICLVALLVAWYTIRGRIQVSQIILGIFSYILVMLLENIFDMLGGYTGLVQTGLAYGLYVTLSVVAAREIIRILAMKYGLQPSFQDTDSALGFALGFAGVYLGVCAAYYFNCYTAAAAYVSSGAEEFILNSGSDAEEALELLEAISGESGWQFLLTGINRVFFLVREMALSVLLWYALTDGRCRRFYALVPAMHFVAMLPDGLYQAELITSTYLRDGGVCVFTAGIAFVAAQVYNRREDQVAHFKVEKLRARRRR